MKRIFALILAVCLLIGAACRTQEAPDNTRNEALVPDGKISKIEVSSLPEGYHYGFQDSTRTEAVRSYFNSLELSDRYTDDPDEYSGMTWVVEITFSDGRETTLYHFGNMFVRNGSGPWFRMDYEEAFRFSGLLEKLDRQSAEAPSDTPDEQDREEPEGLSDEEFAALMERLTKEAYEPAAMKYVPYPYDESGRETGDYSAWAAQRREKNAYAHQADGLWPYYTRMLQTFLASPEGENRVLSPVNVFFALAMLAEVTDGEARDEILRALDTDSLDALREEVKAVWTVNSADDGAYASVLGASVWLSDRFRYDEETLKRLAEVYYASAYIGTMGSEEYDRALGAWLDHWTRGLLKDEASTVRLDRNTALALATTVYLKASWESRFSEAANTEDTFRGASGNETAVFMHRSLEHQSVFYGTRFSAAFLSAGNGCSKMWFILPEEGTTPDELLQDPEAMAFLSEQTAWKASKNGTVVFSMPKFDVSSGTDLIGGLRTLGIRKVFDAYSKPDFSPILKDDIDVFVDSAIHAARVRVDEEGVEGAAFTVIIAKATSAMNPEERIIFTLDRPFLFMVTGPDGAPLFAGTVNTVKQ